MNELMNWDPFQELDAMQDRMTRVFNRAWSGQVFNAPATDIYEEDGKLVLETALPNFKDEEVEVNINQDRLEIKAEHNESNESKERNYLRRESSVRSYYRQFALPKDVNVDSGNAQFENGVLRVTFDHQELPQPKKLKLKKGSDRKELPEEK